jgi:hypothetical protein
MIQYRHCPTCEEEYNATMLVCVECGGPLTDGPLEYFETGARGARGSDDDDDDELLESDDEHLVVDQELAKLPGIQADVIVQGLLDEQIPCAVEIGGRRTLYAPDGPRPQPFGITTPVTVFVAAEHHEPAHDMLVSLPEEDDAIGEQWAAATAALEAEMQDDDQAGPSEVAVDQSADAPTPESHSLLTIAVVVIVGILVLVFFGRR